MTFNSILTATLELAPLRNITKTRTIEIAKLSVCPIMGKKFKIGSRPKRKFPILNLPSIRLASLMTHLKSLSMRSLGERGVVSIYLLKFKNPVNITSQLYWFDTNIQVRGCSRSVRRLQFYFSH